MRTYQEFKNQLQKEFNAFPMKAAFNDNQFKDMMTSWGFKEDETEKICSIGYGCFIRKSDKEAFKKMTARHEQMEKEFLSDMTNFEDAVYYEMCNHEYGINLQGAYDVLTALGFDCEYGNEYDCLNTEQSYAYCRARERYDRAAEENEWF